MNSKSFLKNFFPVDQIAIEDRIKKLFSRSIKKKSKIEALYIALSMLDLTTLEGKDSPGKVKNLCYKAAHLYDILPGLPTVAAICVYPKFVKIAKNSLEGTNIKVASVATGFPSGMNSLNEKLLEVKKIIDNGADEIDMVISRGEYLRGNFDYVCEEIFKIKEICGNKHLKVILETGELETLDNVRKASFLAMYSGADFIKTSTGKISPSAVPSVVLTMLEAISDYYKETGIKVGMKPAGGISTAKQSIQYLVMVKETLGTDWLNPDLFRFGASSLANDILLQIVKQNSGIYQSPDYFSID